MLVYNLTPEIRTLSSVPRVSGLERFHYYIIYIQGIVNPVKATKHTDFGRGIKLVRKSLSFFACISYYMIHSQRTSRVFPLLSDHKPITSLYGRCLVSLCLLLMWRLWMKRRRRRENLKSSCSSGRRQRSTQTQLHTWPLYKLKH